MDIQSIMQDERKKKFIIIGLVVFFIIMIGGLFFLMRTSNTTQGNDDQLLSDISQLTPRDNVSQNTSDRINKLPVITLSSDSAIVTPGQPTVISWESPNSEGCADGEGNEVKTSGSLSITPTESYTQDIVCTNQKGTSFESLTVQVTTSPIITLSAYPKSVQAGEQAFISWSTSNTTRCVDTAGKTLRLSDSFSVSPKKPYTFEMSCVGPNGSGKNSVTITIASPKQIAQKNGADKMGPTITGITSTTASVGVTPVKTSTVTTQRNTTPTGSGVAPRGGGNANIKLTINSSTVKYGEPSTVSWTIDNAKNCTATTPTGVEILSKTPGEASIILMPGQRVPTPPGSLPLSGNVAIKVLSGKTSATLTIRCVDPNGVPTERSITVASAPQTIDICKDFGRPTMRMFANPTAVENGNTSAITWNTTCATACTAQADPWGEAIEYVDTSKIVDYIDGLDYNNYSNIHNLLVGVNVNGGVRVTPGTSDPEPLLPEQTQSQDGVFSFFRQIPQSSTVTLKCTNSSGGTSYSTTKSVTVSIIVHPSGCSTGVLGMGCGFW